MANQILDKKEIAKNANNDVDLEHQYEKLSKENIQRDSNNSYISSNINTHQQRYILNYYKTFQKKLWT